MSEATSGLRNVVELQGWKADGRSSRGPPDGTDSVNCLERCHGRRGCRFVSYNLNTGACAGFTAAEKPHRVIDPFYSLLAVSAKQFHVEKNTSYPGHELFCDSCVIVTHKPCLCPILCHIYPQCNVVNYSEFWKGCWLYAKTTLNPQISSDAIAFVS